MNVARQKKEVYVPANGGRREGKEVKRMMSMRYRATVSIFKYFSFLLNKLRNSRGCERQPVKRRTDWKENSTTESHMHTYKTFYNYTHMIVSGSAAEMAEYILLFFNWSGFVLFCFVRVDESVLFIIITKQSSCCLPSRTFAKKKNKALNVSFC